LFTLGAKGIGISVLFFSAADRFLEELVFMWRLNPWKKRYLITWDPKNGDRKEILVRSFTIFS
jgi:hypothetical protein